MIYFYRTWGATRLPMYGSGYGYSSTTAATTTTTTRTTTTTKPSIKCEYVPKENCTTVEAKTREVCDKIVKEVPDQVSTAVPYLTHCYQ